MEVSGSLGWKSSLLTKTNKPTKISSMNFTDIKVYGFNAISLMITFTDVEDVVKMILMLASIGYTLHKWYLMHQNSKKDGGED